MGNQFGSRFERPATIAGGVVLVLLGVKILLEHLGIFAWIRSDGRTLAKPCAPRGSYRLPIGGAGRLDFVAAHRLNTP